MEYDFLEVEGGSSSHARFMSASLALNIIEATDIDRQLGVNGNAGIGVALAASVFSAMPSVDSNQNFIFPFTKGWFDAYNVWNLNYVTNFNNLHLPTKLLIPSLLCTSDASVRSHWLTSRSVTLKSIFLPVIYEDATRKAEQRVLSVPPPLREAAARTAISHADRFTLPHPRHCCGHGSQRKLWDTVKSYNPRISGMTSFMSHRSFHVYFTAIVWSAVVLAGLGSEVVIGNAIAAYTASSEHGFLIWHLAQLVFALMLCVAFTADGGLGLPFLAAGLWK